MIFVIYKSIDILIEHLTVDRTKIGGLFKIWTNVDNDQEDLYPSDNIFCKILEHIIKENTNFTINTYVILRYPEF